MAMNKQPKQCRCHGGSNKDIFVCDGGNLAFFQKLKRDTYGKWSYLQSIKVKVDERQGKVEQGSYKDFNDFISMHDTLSSNPLYGFKWPKIGIVYHKVTSEQSRHVQFQCSECGWATMPYYFLHTDKALQEFLNDFNKITKGLTVVDPVDLRGYTPGMPGDYPKPEGYRCQIEDGRRQNDHLKLWFSFKNVEAKITAAERHSIAEAVLEDVARKENKADALACLKKWLFESEETPKGLALRNLVPTVSVEKAPESGESEEQRTNHDNASAQALRGPDSWNASSCDKPWTNGTNGECGAKNRGSAVK